MARRAYKPVVTVTRNRHGAKLANQEAADDVRRIRADTRLEPGFHGSVQRKGSEHRTRNSVTAITAGDGPFCTILFSLKILAGPSTTPRSVSCAATGLGSKMVADVLFSFHAAAKAGCNPRCWREMGWPTRL